MAKGGKSAASADESAATSTSAPTRPRAMQRLEIEGYAVEGISIAGHETCVMFPSLNLAFDIGRCPLFAVSQDLLFVSHAHMDHIGGLPLYVAMRGCRRMRPPTVFVPTCLADLVRKLFEVHRAMDQSDLDHKSTYLDNSKSIEDAREKGHTHLSEIASLSDKLENKAILLNHFSNRYTAEDIDAAINRLPPSLRSRVYALKEGFLEKT